jgi:hypothetical protein
LRDAFMAESSKGHARETVPTASGPTMLGKSPIR